MMNIHLLPDNKFIDSFIEKAKSICNVESDKYVIWYTGSQLRELTYVKSHEVIHAPLLSESFKNIIDNLHAGDNVIIHWLGPEICNVVSRIPKDVLLTWSVWGGDFYSPLRYFKDDLLDSTSIDYLRAENRIKIGLNPKWPLLQLKGSAMLWLEDYKRYKLKAKAIARINRICNFDDTIFQIIRDRFKTSASFFWFCYGGLPDSLLQTQHSSATSDNPQAGLLRILVGNSSTIENNHLSILASLGRHSLANRMQIICPLSYGNDYYGNNVEKEGSLLFQDRFMALREFMDESSYFKILQTCNIAVMNHKRTQAAGNIVAMLAMGKKVFMNSQNSLFKYLIGQGVVLFSIETLLSSSAESVLHALSPEDQNKNRKILHRVFWGKATEDGYREMMRARRN